MASASLRLWLLTAEPRYRSAAEQAMATVAGLAAQRPMSFGAALSVMVALESDPTQLVVVSDEADELTAFTRTRRSPGSIASVVTSAQARAFENAGFELYAGRTALDARTTAYACREFVCALPVHMLDELRL